MNKYNDMGLFGSGKKIEQYRTNLTNNIQYNRAVKKGGEPIMRLLDLMMTAIDYDPKSRPIHRLIRDVGLRLGGGYLGYPESTEKILQAALTYAEYSLRQNKTMTVEAWHDTVFAIAISLETKYASTLQEAEKLKKNNAELEEKLRNAEREYRTMMDMLSEKPKSKAFNVRQTAIIAYALCKKSGVIPKNKKNIGILFNELTGYSSNTIGQNLCSTYSDKEIEKIAQDVEKSMPEFAEYLRQKTFFLPEITK